MSITRLLSAILLGVHAWVAAKPIPVEITLFGSPQKDPAVIKEITKGIEGLQESLRKYCDIEDVIEIQETLFVTRQEGKLHLERTQTPESKRDVFPFQFYQYSLWEMLKRYDFAPAPELISILVLDRVDTLGHAFPRVQFPSAFDRESQKDELKLMLNRIVVEAPHQTPMGTKVVAHEIAHLLIQDDPPHTCDEDGQRKPCPPDNILTSYKQIPAPPRFQRNRFGGDFESPERSSDPFEYEDPGFTKVFSKGLELEKSQCAAIRKHLESFGDLEPAK